MKISTFIIASNVLQKPGITLYISTLIAAPQDKTERFVHRTAHITLAVQKIPTIPFCIKAAPQNVCKFA